MLNWLRKQLGIDKIYDEQHLTNLLLGRIVAKIDPMYAINEIPKYDDTLEDDTVIARAQESGRLGNEVILKIIAEENARRHTLGEAPLSPTELDYLRR